MIVRAVLDQNPRRIGSIVFGISKLPTRDPLWSEMRSRLDNFFARNHAHPFHRDRKELTLRLGRDVVGFSFESYLIVISKVVGDRVQMMSKGDRSELSRDDLRQSRAPDPSKRWRIDRRPFRIEIAEGRAA